MPQQNQPVVVVGVDGSPDSQKALAWAEQYAVATGARLRLVTAWARPISFGFEMHVDGYQPDAAARAVSEKARAGVSMADRDVDTSVLKGAAPTVLVDASRGASLLVVGQQGHSGWDRAVVGSVTSYCLRDATCPVVVVQ